MIVNRDVPFWAPGLPDDVCVTRNFVEFAERGTYLWDLPGNYGWVYVDDLTGIQNTIEALVYAKARRQVSAYQ